MSNFINYANAGTEITGEKVYVSGKSEVTLAHDNYFELSLYYDSECANAIDAGLYTKDEYDATYQGYNKIELDSAIYDSYTVIYASYKTKGDYVDADDMNKKLDKVIHKECGQDIIANRAVILKNGKLWYPNLLVESDVWKIQGIASQSGSEHQKIDVYTEGEMTDQTWSWDVTKDIFIGDNGALTQTAPTTGTIKIIATPISPITIKIVNLIEITRR